VQKKKTPAPTGIPTELSRLLKRRNLYKTVVVKSERMSRIEHNIKTDLRVWHDKRIHLAQNRVKWLTNVEMLLERTMQ